MPDMSDNKRLLPRFPDFARVHITELCRLPGVLEDASQNGCRVRFNDRFPVETDREYRMTLASAPRSGLGEIQLIVRPEWVHCECDSQEIGFSVLHSPGLRQYLRYIENLSEQYDVELQEA